MSDSSDPSAPTPKKTVKVVGRIGTDPDELRGWADTVVDRGEPIHDMEIVDLHALIAAVQAHPRSNLAPTWKRGNPPRADGSLNHITTLRIRGGRILASSGGAFVGSDQLRFEVCLSIDLMCHLADGINLGSMTFASTASFAGSTFEGSVSFGHSSWAASVSFFDSRFDGYAMLESTHFADVVSFDEARFADDVSFHGACFGRNASFQDAVFADTAHFAQAEFTGDASFGKARFAEKSVFREAKFRRWAWFGDATFEETIDFSNTDLRHLEVGTDTDLRRWKLDGVRGMRLDGTDLKDVRFPPHTGEAWHTIRRAYTGTKFFFNLLLLVVFFGASAAKVAMWLGVNHSQVAIKHLAEKAEAASDRAAKSIEALGQRDAARVGDLTENASVKIETGATVAANKVEPVAPGLAAQVEKVGDAAAAQSRVVGGAAATQISEAATALADVARELKGVKESLTPETQKYRVGQVLLSMDRGWSAMALAISLLVYNIFRAWLTNNVGTMRDESDRSGVAPYWKDYKRAWYIHIYFMRWLTWVAILSFVWHAWGWVSAPVWLPARSSAVAN